MKKRQSVGEAGPLSLYARGFREYLEGKGYATDSVRWRLRQFTALDHWLRDHRLAADDLDAACVDRLVAARRAEERTTLVAVANFSVPIGYLREIGAVPPEASSQSDPVSQILQRYRGYLATERGLVESSISVNMRVAESFCSKRGLRLEELSAAEITAYIAALSARSSIGWSVKTVSALASFLRFLHVTGVTARPLAAALPKIAGHRLEVVPGLVEFEWRSPA
jgi:integrase/recombinase XerD